jgi:hypothetical protein
MVSILKTPYSTSALDILKQEASFIDDYFRTFFIRQKFMNESTQDPENVSGFSRNAVYCVLINGFY